MTFHNDGSYGENCLLRPFLINDYPIGFIREVADDTVICEIFDDYFFRDQRGVNVMTKEQDIRAVGLRYPKSEQRYW